MSLPDNIADCHQIILEQRALISELLSRLSKVEAELTKLQQQVAKNSKNSHKPPSSDGLKKKPAFARKRGGKRGGQVGHQGKTLELVAAPDIEIPLLPERCSCGALLDSDKASIGERRQVFDIPPPRLEVTEYQKLVCKCGHCGLTTAGEFPESVISPTQYGSGVRAFTSLLNCGFAMPVGKIRRLFTDLFGYAINEGTITKNNERASDLLKPVETQIKENLIAAPLGHSDETGMRIAGRLHWLHVFSNALYTFFFVHTHRGKEALNDTMSILPHYSGWVVHDCWKSYFLFKGCKHAICGAHILRELTALEEQNVVWAKSFKDYLLTLLQWSKANNGRLTAEQQRIALVSYRQICATANRIEPLPIKQKGKRGRPKATKGRNLLNRLMEHQEAVLAFAFHSEVPFTNNLAERDLRPMKTKQKVSGCFRTLKGAEQHARIYGFISTVRKHQLNIFNELKKVFQEEPFSFDFAKG